MCGIAGIVNIKGMKDPTEAQLRLMGSVLDHRGPDGEGYYTSEGVGFAHRRLSIIDLAGGAQPMSTPDGCVVVAFNGEIYNFLEIRKDLESRGHKFRTKSDTEVLLESYREWGEECLCRINGMFAFAIWDGSRRMIFAARDRFGKKPFYYYLDKEKFVFASEIKAILACEGIRCDLDPVALDEYLTHTFIPAPRTIYRQIKKLEPAHFLILKDGKMRIHSYWNVQFGGMSPSRREDEILEEFEALFKDAVRLRMISDVPLGAFLSGGLDSSAIVGMMADLSQKPIRTFTIGFEEDGYSEIEDARKIASHFRTNHEEFFVRSDAVGILPDLVWHMDEPFGDSSAIPTYYVAKMASQRVKVVLTGDGGDEVFGGYRRYLEALKRVRWAFIPLSLRKQLLLPLSRMLPINAPAKNFLYYLGNLDPLAPGSRNGIYPFIKENLYNEEFRRLVRGNNPFKITEDCIERSRGLDLVSRLQLLDINNYLTNDILFKIDRMSMAHSIELRSPFLDYRIVEFVATLPQNMRISKGTTKVLLRKHLMGKLPMESFRKPKQGFGIPKAAWFRRDLKEYAAGVVLDEGGLGRDIFRRDILIRIINEHQKGTRDYSEWIWCLMVLELWHRRFSKYYYKTA